MKPITRKSKDARGRIRGFVAKLGPVETFEPLATSPAASEACEQAALAALERLARATRIGTWHGHVYVVSPTIDGWEYWIDTSVQGSVCHIPGTKALEDAEDSALYHLAQNLWELSVNDDEFLIGLPADCTRTLREWIRFQRSYAALKASGASDAEAHRQAASAS